MKRFLTLGAIIGPLPATILDGQVADAGPVMANFNWIVAQVNANVSAVSAGVAIVVPSGGVGGTANAITLTPTTPITSYVYGQTFIFAPTATNTGAVTINISGLGPVAVTAGGSGFGLTGGEISTGVLVEVCFGVGGTALVLFTTNTGKSTPFLPTLAFGGASVGVTYGLQSGSLFKYGNSMHFSVDLLLTSKGSSTGNATITGLSPVVNAVYPFPSGSTACPAIFTNVTFASGYLGGLLTAGGSTVRLVKVTSAGTIANLTDADFTNTSEIIVSGSYPV